MQELFGELPQRFATLEELEGYIGYHRGLIIQVVNGVDDVTIGEDDQGAFAMFHVREDPDDGREMSMEEAAYRLGWQAGGEKIKVRVKAQRITDESQEPL